MIAIHAQQLFVEKFCPIMNHNRIIGFVPLFFWVGLLLSSEATIFVIYLFIFNEGIEISFVQKQRQGKGIYFLAYYQFDKMS